MNHSNMSVTNLNTFELVLIMNPFQLLPKKIKIIIYKYLVIIYGRNC